MGRSRARLRLGHYPNFHARSEMSPTIATALRSVKPASSSFSLHWIAVTPPLWPFSREHEPGLAGGRSALPDRLRWGTSGYACSDERRSAEP